MTFLFLLVLELNVDARATIRDERLRLGGLAAVLYMVLRESELDEQRGSAQSGSPNRLFVLSEVWARDMATQVIELHAVDEARTQLEREHLAGHQTLFAGAATALEKLRIASEGLAKLGVSVLELQFDGTRRERPTVDLNLDALHAEGRARAPEKAAQILASVRHTGFGIFGELDKALQVGQRLFTSLRSTRP